MIARPKPPEGDSWIEYVISHSKDGMPVPLADAARVLALAELAELRRAAEAWEAMRLLERECWDLRCLSLPTGGGDYDVEWVVLSHHMDRPHERERGRGASAIDAVLAAAKAGEAGR